MKRFVLMALVVGVAATAASATTIGIQFRDFPDTTKVFLAESETVVVDVIVSIPAGGTLSGFAGEFEPVLDDNLDIVDSSAAPAGWQDVSVWGTLGAPGTGGPGFPGATKAAYAAVPGNELGAGDFLLGSVTIHLTTFVPDQPQKEVVFNAAFTSLFDADGAGLSYAPTYAGTYGSYWGYGQYGSPGATGPFGAVDARSPLFIQKVPEPTSLAFLVLGGLALVRRRR